MLITIVTIAKDAGPPVSAAEFFGVEPEVGEEYTFEYVEDLTENATVFEMTVRERRNGSEPSSSMTGLALTDLLIVSQGKC